MRARPMENDFNQIGAALLWLLGGSGLLLFCATAMSQWLAHRRWKRWAKHARRTQRWG